MTISATYIRTAIDELLAGTIGSTRVITAGTVAKGHEGAFEGQTLSGVRYDLSIGSMTPSPATPLSAIASYRIDNLAVTVRLYFHQTSPITEADRDAVRATVLSTSDSIRQALGYRGNLSMTAAGYPTGIISGMLTNMAVSEPIEDWEKQIVTVEITGTAIVQITQAV